ncbi:MAG: endo alpha-1,4 polygalactosaminidase [Proteobacteria bacterium]|nr:endo alpha-1,4 polygalactosaminidase [Pseudomonadota bacterium]
MNAPQVFWPMGLSLCLLLAACQNDGASPQTELPSGDTDAKGTDDTATDAHNGTDNTATDTNGPDGTDNTTTDANGTDDTGDIATDAHSTDDTGDTATDADDTATDADDTDTTTPNAIRLPPANAPWDYQIGKPYTPPQGVAVVSRDREASPAPGLYNICYVNGFQTQPHEQSWWLAEHPDLILRDAQGDPIIDDDWNEMLFDTTTADKRQRLAAIVGAWIDGCAQDGFDAVEIDNLDSYGRSSGRISQQNNVDFMALLSERGHSQGLAMGQKNAAEIVSRAQQMGTDFAIAEECNRWDECDVYQGAYGDRVFVVEYRRVDFDKGCAAFPELSIVFRDMNVTAPGSSTYVYDGC